MLQNNQLKDILANINSLLEDDISNIKNYIQKYPYFSVLYTLFAKVAYKFNCNFKNKAIEKASIYANDRAYLKKVIESCDNIVASDFEIEKEEDQQEDLSKTSTILNDDLLTEKLAEIMYQQNKISEAIYIYNKLSLKFPQKKAYFVNKIKLLRNSYQYN